MDSRDRFAAILVICVLVMFLAIMGASFLDGAHERTVAHACQMAAIEARYPSADAVVICNLK